MAVFVFVGRDLGREERRTQATCNEDKNSHATVSRPAVKHHGENPACGCPLSDRSLGKYRAKAIHVKLQMG
jgi:hypothetical protein